MARIVWWTKALFTSNEIKISSKDLDISFAELRGLFLEYLAEHNPAAKDDTR